MQFHRIKHLLFNIGKTYKCKTGVINERKKIKLNLNLNKVRRRNGEFLTNNKNKNIYFEQCEQYKAGEKEMVLSVAVLAP